MAYGELTREQLEQYVAEHAYLFPHSEMLERAKRSMKARERRRRLYWAISLWLRYPLRTARREWSAWLARRAAKRLLKTMSWRMKAKGSALGPMKALYPSRFTRERAREWAEASGAQL